MQHFQFRYLLFLSLFFFCSQASAQMDLLSAIEDSTPKKEFVTNSFKSTRVIAGQSIENVGPGVLDFRILHRFGRVNEGAYGAYGLDNATIRLGLDYGISKRLMIGIGRSSYKKEVDAFAKFKLFWQAKGGGSPVTVSLLSSVIRDGLEFSEPDRENYNTSRYSYSFQMLIGRKFSEAFTFQIAPTLVHRNLVKNAEDKNDIYSMGFGTRIKLTKRFALTAEYFYTNPSDLDEGYTNPFAVGVDIETGGHVFQLHFTNSLGMNDKELITGTSGIWADGDVHFGFNISRVFTLSKPKEFRKNNSTE
jgi:Membrane bound beta barrel domain (DUF5777)